MKLWESRPMPDRERVWLTRITLTVWAGVLAWNVSHVQEHLGQHATHGWRMWALSFGPDVLILIGVWKLRYRAADVVGWLMTTVGLSWLAWAALSTAEASASGRMIAMAPIGTVVLMTLALEFEGRSDRVEGSIGSTESGSIEAPNQGTTNGQDRGSIDLAESIGSRSIDDQDRGRIEVDREAIEIGDRGSIVTPDPIQWIDHDRGTDGSSRIGSDRGPVEESQPRRVVALADRIGNRIEVTEIEARAEDVTRLRKAIRNDELPEHPSNEAARKYLHVAPKYARAAVQAIEAERQQGTQARVRSR